MNANGVGFKSSNRPLEIASCKDLMGATNIEDVLEILSYYFIKKIIINKN
jgi:hypothetical protein